MILRKPFTVREIPLKLESSLPGITGTFPGKERYGGYVCRTGSSRTIGASRSEIFARSDIVKAAAVVVRIHQKSQRDPRVWWLYNGTGDEFITKKAPRPWISEMYGYVFGVASAGLSHNVKQILTFKCTPDQNRGTRRVRTLRHSLWFKNE